MRAVTCLAALAALVAGGSSILAQPGPAPALPQAPPRAQIALDLNKLEAASGACRAYFVVENRTAERVAELRLDTFIFDPSGVIARRVGLTFPDLRPGRAKVVPFDLAGSSCTDFSRLLVNDVLACTGQSGAPVPQCSDLIVTTSRVGVAFEF